MSTKGNNSDNLIDVQHELTWRFFVFRIQPFFLDPFNNETFSKYDAHNDDYRFLKHLD